MAGDHEPYDDPKLKGLSRYFNNYTIRGRANVAIATYAGLFGYFIYKKVTKKIEERRIEQLFEDEDDNDDY